MRERKPYQPKEEPEMVKKLIALSLIASSIFFTGCTTENTKVEQPPKKSLNEQLADDLAKEFGTYSLALNEEEEKAINHAIYMAEKGDIEHADKWEAEYERLVDAYATRINKQLEISKKK